jgi:hypothetical protein
MKMPFKRKKNPVVAAHNTTPLLHPENRLRNFNNRAIWTLGFGLREVKDVKE